MELAIIFHMVCRERERRRGEQRKKKGENRRVESRQRGLNFDQASCHPTGRIT